MLKIASLRFDDITLGQEVHFAVLLTENLIEQFADLSGDKNPLHVDPEYAKTTQFGGTIAHGMLGASFFSRLVGMHLPGRYALYLSQKLVFRNPCRTGMNLLVRGEVIQKTETTQTITLRTQVLDEAGLCLIDGEAIVKLLE